MNNETYPTNYGFAVNYLRNNFIFVNCFEDIDNSVYDNARFEWFEEDEDGNEKPVEIYQYYITDCNETDVEFLEKTFPKLLFSYSDLLDCFVLCVNNWGTNWYHVEFETTLEQAKRELGERE